MGSCSLLQGIFPTQESNQGLLHCGQIPYQLSYQRIPTLTVKVKVKSLFATLWTVAYQAPPSMGLSRQEYWSGLPFPSPGDLPDPGIEPRSPTLEADALTSEQPGKPNRTQQYHTWVCTQEKCMPMSTQRQGDGWSEQHYSFCLIFMWFLKVTFHLQSFQSIGCISHVV